MRVVADASPLIILAQTNLLHLLPVLLGDIWVPRKVWTEITVRPEIAARFAESEVPWLHVQAVDDSETTLLLQEDLNAGEAEAIVLAEEIGASTLLIDERRGRTIATSRGLEVIGTLGLLLLAKDEGLLSQIKPIVLQMRDEFAFRVSEQLIALMDDRTIG